MFYIIMTDQLYLFSAGSFNDDLNKHLWLIGASQFIPQINELLEQTNFNFNIMDVKEFQNDSSDTLGRIL